MAAVRSQDATCRIVEERIMELEKKAGRIPDYNGVVMMDGMLLVLDDMECNLYNGNDGKLNTSHRLESSPYDVCRINKTEVGVSLWDGPVVILALKSVHNVKLVKTLKTELRPCHSLAKCNSDKLVICGQNYDNMLCWRMLSFTDGHLDPAHVICKGGWTHVAVTDNAVYISCLTYDSITKGVYAFDLLNPNKKKFLYRHQKLQKPGSIMADRDCVYVCDGNSIHQLTDSGQLVTIHTVPSQPYSMFFDDQKGLLYTTSKESNVITVYKIKSLHQPGVPIEIMNMDDRSIQLFEEALKDGEETVHSIRVMVVGHMGVGKTTLVKRLLGDEVNISERHSTEGIDVYVNCCDVSLSTHEWTRRTKDLGQDYSLQRVAKVLNEKHSVAGKVSDELVLNPLENDRTESREDSHAPVKDQNSEMIHHSSGQDVDQNILFATNQQDKSNSHPKEESTSHEQKESSSVVAQTTSTQAKANTIAMIKLLKENFNKIEDSGENSLLTIWDFAGQYAFYTTHQTFLTRRAIYLLVSDVSGHVTDLVADDCYFDSKGKMKCQVHELVEVWLNSIHSCAESPKADSPPVILVGTHVDKISQGTHHEICKRYFREIRSYLKDKPTRFHLIDEDFAIDNTVVDKRLEDLKRKIVEIASQQSYWGEKIPARWLTLEQELMRRKASGVKVISREDVDKINKEGIVPIGKSEEVDLFLRYLHETGLIIYFSVVILRENIVLDPTWLIDVFKTLINSQPDWTEGPDDKVVLQKWSDFKETGILSSELIDAIWTQEKYPELHAHKEHMLLIMEQLNIIAKPRAFSEIGEKNESFFLTPCMLRQESPKEIISPEHDPMLVSTPVLCCVFTGKFLPPPIFHRLIAACITRWPVAKKKETSENLIFCGCCVFNIDLFHRLTLHCKNHIVFARLTRLVVDEVKNPDAMLCSRVRKFITLNLSRITSYLGQNLKYDLCTWWSPSQVLSEDGSAAPCQMWFSDEGHDSDAPISPEHMNHARIYVALVTVCTRALRDILLSHVPYPYKGIYKAIWAKKADLTKKIQTRRGQWQNALLLPDQCQVVFPDPRGRYVASVDQFDITLLYILIRNVSTVSASVMGWGMDPLEEPFRDKCLGASVERIRSYRNQIGHSMDGKMSQQDFDSYWNKIYAVLADIEQDIGREGYYRAHLDTQKRQVISVYEAC